MERPNTGNISGLNKYHFLLSTLLITITSLWLFNCSWQSKDIIEEAYEYYIIQDTISLFELIESISSDSFNREFQIVNQFAQLSKGNFDLKHGLTDSTDTWYRILEGRRCFYNLNIESSWNLNNPLFNKFEELSWPEKSEILINHLLISRHIDTKDSIVSQLHKTSKQINDNPNHLNRVNILSSIILSEYLGNIGLIDDAMLSLNTLIQIINSDYNNDITLKALCLSSLSSILIRERKPSIKKNIDQLLDFSKNYPVLSNEYRHAISNKSYVFVESNRDSAFFYANHAIELKNSTPITNVYCLLNGGYIYEKTGFFNEAERIFDRAINSISTNPCNRIYKYLVFYKANYYQSVKTKMRSLTSIAESKCPIIELKILSANSLSEMYFQSKDYANSLKYSNLLDSLYSEFYSYKNDIHYSKMIAQKNNTKANALFHLSKNGISAKRIFIENIRRSKKYITNRTQFFDKDHKVALNYLPYEAKVKRALHKIENGPQQIHDSPLEILKILEYRINTLLQQLNDYNNITDISSKSDAKDSESSLSNTTLNIEFYKTDSFYYSYGITHSDTFINRIKTTTIDSLLYKSSSLLSDPNSSNNKITQFSSQLYDTLIHPFFQDSISQINIVPDGQLNHYPFGSLYDKRNNSYLIGLCDINYPANSAALLNTNHKVTIDSVCLLSYTDKSTLKSLNPKIVPELPNAPAEIEVISNIFKDSHFIKHTGSNMTIDKLDDLYQFDVLHIISHSYSNPNQLRENYIYLRDAKTSESSKWYAYNLIGKNLNIELVVLNSCSTSMGYHQNSDYTYSIAQDFLTAGCKNVLSTMWEIDDRFALYFASNFYEYCKYYSPNKAINLVKRKCINNSKYAHPSHWSSYKNTYQ